MTNRVLPYLLALILVSWTTEKQCLPAGKPQKGKTEIAVYQFHPVASIQVPGKTINKNQRFVRRMPVSPIPSHPPILFLGDMGNTLASASFQDKNLAVAVNAGLEKGHFRHLYPSHYFW